MRRNISDLIEHRLEGAEALLDARHRRRQLADMAGSAEHVGARCCHLGARGLSGALRVARRIVDAAVAGDHRLGGIVQGAEVVGLLRHARRHLLDISGDIRDLDAEAAQPARQLGDDTIGLAAFRSGPQLGPPARRCPHSKPTSMKTSFDTPE